MELNDGKYKAKAAEWGLGETSTGKEQIAITFDLLDPDFAGQRITYFGFFTEESLQYTIKNMRTCGWEGDDLLELGGLDKNEVILVVENEEYNGKVTPKVKFINALGGLALKTPMTPAKQQSFAAQMRQRIAALDAFERQGSGGKPTPRPSAKPNGRVKQTVGGDPRDVPPPDDMPF